jgi:hypothetical protein
MERTCTITIDPKGQKMTVDLDGFQGVGCGAITEALESMGAKINEIDKPEFYQNQNQNGISSGT